MMHASNRAGHVFGRLILASRWLLLPFFVGLIVAILVLLVRFVGRLIAVVASLWETDDHEVVLAVLGLVDMTLIASLVLILLFSGYDNFVSRIGGLLPKLRPAWLESASFLDLKIKLIGTMVVISGVELLRVFLHSEEYTSTQLLWKVGMHLTFVLATVLLALTNWLMHRANGEG